jgi:hypothetical protein
MADVGRMTRLRAGACRPWPFARSFAEPRCRYDRAMTVLVVTGIVIVLVLAWLVVGFTRAKARRNAKATPPHEWVRRSNCGSPDTTD